MEAEMQERRKQPRKDLMSYSQVHQLHDGKLIGYLGDLTLLGAMVISDNQMAANSNLMISIELPELPGISDLSMTMSARVAWCRQDISPEYFNVGLEFYSITDKQKTIIELVLENYEFRRQAPNYPPHPNELEQDQ
jgi:hypothetical protein